jgi:hypothetical protein
MLHQVAMFAFFNKEKIVDRMYTYIYILLASQILCALKCFLHYCHKLKTKFKFSCHRFVIFILNKNDNDFVFHDIIFKFCFH